MSDRSVLTISRFDDRDYGVYRCFGTVRPRYSDAGRLRRSRNDHVFMEVLFFPDEFGARSRYRDLRSRYLY